MALSVAHVKNNTIADWSGTVTVGNSTGGTTTMAASDMVRPSDWNSGHNITWPKVSFFEPYPPVSSSLSDPGVGTWYFSPFQLDAPIGSGQIYILNADAAGFLHGTTFSATTTGSVSRYQTLDFQLAIYSQGTGTATSVLNSYWSKRISGLATWSKGVSAITTTGSITVTNALTLSFPAQWDVSGGVTYSSTAQSGTRSTTASTAPSSFADSLITGAVAYLSGSRLLVFPFDTTLDAGNYWMAHMYTSTSSSTGTAYSQGTMFGSQSLVHNLHVVDRAFKRLGKSVSDATSMVFQFQGSLATTTSTPTSLWELLTSATWRRTIACTGTTRIPVTDEAAAFNTGNANGRNPQW